MYLLVFNLISMANFEEMQKLEVIIENAQVHLANLQVKEVFQLNLEKEDESTSR